MTEKQIDFEGTPGTAVVVGQNDIYELNQGVPYYSSDKAFGSSSVRTGNPPDTTDVRFRVALGISGDHYGSIYMKNTTPHGGGGTNAVNFFHLVTSTGAWIAQVRATASNGLGIRSNNVDVRAGGLNEIPVNQWFRFEWGMEGTTFHYQLFPNTTEEDTPVANGSIATGWNTTPATSLLLGAQSAFVIPKDWSFDMLRVSDTRSTFFGPYEPPGSPTTGVTVWNGVAEVPISSISVWNGIEEVPASFDTIV